MDNLCSSKNQNSFMEWLNIILGLTSCDSEGKLIALPITVFWLLLPIEVIYIMKSKSKKLPWKFLDITKIIILLMTICSSIAEIFLIGIDLNSENCVGTKYHKAILVIVTLVAIAVVNLFRRNKEIASSGVLFLFWLLFCFPTGKSFYNSLLKLITDNNYMNRYKMGFGIKCVNFFTAVAQFILQCFPDQESRKRLVKSNVCTFYQASFLSKITFWWLNPMVFLGYKRSLKMEDLWDLHEKHHVDTLQKRFDKHWLPYFKSLKYQKVSSSGEMSKNNLEGEKVVLENEIKGRAKFSLLIAILKTFWPDILMTVFLKFVSGTIILFNPLILDALIGFLDSKEHYSIGVWYACALLFIVMINTFLKGQHDFKIDIICMKIRSTLVSVTYRKVLTLSTAVKKDYSTGEIVNLMFVDITKIEEFIQAMNALWIGPFQIAIAIYIVWQKLGVAACGFVAVVIVITSINIFSNFFMRRLFVQLMKHKDKRIKLLSDIISGIKLLKFYAWEQFFESKIKAIRHKELKYLKLSACIYCLQFLGICGTAPLSGLVCFAIYTLTSSNNILTASKVFVPVSLFNIFVDTLKMLPIAFAKGYTSLISLERLTKFLLSDEIEQNTISHDFNKENAIMIENSRFTWSKDEFPALKIDCLNIKEGSLVAIVGQVGSGKSSLLSALLGEMQNLSGKINVQGSIAYVPQLAWIQNCTLKKNILFANEYNITRYNAVIEACALTLDLEILPGGDETEIGEKGINLSGGQKQRVSLARAIYNDADIYLLDDPLSAVDSHVSEHIFEKVIGPKSFLKNKTRILVTHQINVLPKVDTIVILKNGNVIETGSYKELVSKKGYFAEVLLHYLENNSIDKEQIFQNSPLNEGNKRYDEKSSKFHIQSSSYQSTNKTENTIQSEQLKQIKDDTMNSFKNIDTKNNLATKSKLTTVEGAEMGSVKWSVYYDYMQAYGLLGIILSVLGYAIILIFELTTNLWLAEWSEDARRPNIFPNNYRLKIYAALTLSGVFGSIFAMLAVNWFCITASSNIHNRMLAVILKAPISFFDMTPTGRILNRFSKDIDTIDEPLRMSLRFVYLTSCKLLWSFIIILYKLPIFSAVLLPLGILYYYLQKFYIPTSRQLKRIESITRSPIFSHFTETITGISSIRAYAVTKQFIKNNNYLIDINNTSHFLLKAAASWISVKLDIVINIMIFATALFTVYMKGTITPSTAGLCISIALYVTHIINYLVKMYIDLKMDIIAVERCVEYIQIPTEADWKKMDTKPVSNWPDEGTIVFENYCTRYREDLDLVLKNICCSINSNEKVGIVGRTGAGKSTLTLSLFRIIEPASGRLLIDNVDISKIGLHDLRSKLTIIPQDPVLFAGTLRTNLDPLNQHTDDQIWSSLELLQMKTFASCLVKGLQHDVLECGENLSVGQRQLICLARALLQKNKILILDEATAAVDTDTDEIIQRTIRTAFHDCTVLTIAHRLNTIMDYDRVMVLNQGRIVEFDSPPTLLQNENSIFYSMAKDSKFLCDETLRKRTNK